MATHQDTCGICEQIGRCRDGTHPGLIAEMHTGFAVMGSSQFFEGYCLLLCKAPATELHELPAEVRLAYLVEMSQLAEAVAKVVRPHKLNYECLGNMVHHLHFHVFPRRLSDPKPSDPVWGQMPQGAEAEKFAYDPARHGPLREEIRRALETIRAGV